MARRTFKLLKDTPDYKKGMVVQERCDDGDQEYTSLNHEDCVKFSDHTMYFDDNGTSFSRNAVEDNPTWFVEVFQPETTWLTKDELDAYKKFVSKEKKISKFKK